MNNKQRAINKIKKAAYLCLAALAISCLICACFTGEVGGNASFSITIGGGGRAAFMPWDPDTDISLLIHTITLTGGPGPDIQKKGIIEGETAQFTVDPGHWKITVQAYLSTVLKAEGFASVNLKPGPNGAVSITMGQPTFAITMQNDGHGTATAEPNPAVEGETVYINADPKVGFMFDKWQVISGDITLSHTDKSPASFTMPSEPVKIKAVFIVVPPNTPNLYILEEVIFTPVKFGYTQPAAMTVTIRNSGNTTANVSSITLGGASLGSFILDGNLTPTIAAGASAVFTVQPKSGLNAGDYTAKITASYSGGVVTGATAEIDVSFIVNKAAGVTVGAPTLNAKTHNSITIGAVTASNGQSVKYAISITDSAASTSDWQDSTFFTNLNAATTYYIFARAEGNNNYETGAASVSLSVTTPQIGSSKIIYYWVDEHGNLVTSDDAFTVAAGEDLAITAKADGYTVKQWHLDGVNTGQSEATYFFSSLEVGSHTVGLFVEKDGRLYNTNITVIVQ
ncbi:hypothetical protein R84B8_02909 [Treponema sp. R8-4-B8]